MQTSKVEQQTRHKLQILVIKLSKIVALKENLVTFVAETFSDMKKLTKKEEEIMNLFWDKGAMFVRELLEHYDEPKPHFNTLSTMVRNLEANGYVSHKAYGNSYQYYPVVSREDYAGRTFKGVISSYFNNSYLSAVSALVKEEKITVEELKELIEQIENGQNM